jgi:hypothetical protein
MRLSDAGLHQRQTKALYLNHRLPPWLTEDAPRDRSNRLLDHTPRIGVSCRYLDGDCLRTLRANKNPTAVMAISVVAMAPKNHSQGGVGVLTISR